MIANILTANFNITVIKFLQQFSNPYLDKLAELVTMTGEQYFSIAIMVIIYLCVNKKLAYRLGFASLFSNSINNLVKGIFKVPRPIGTKGVRSLRLETAGGYSFPSGHTQNATVLWTNFMKNLKKKWIYILGSIMIVAVALSRLYLGVHRPVDVIGGFILGTLSMLIVNKVLDFEKSSGSILVLLILIIPMVIITLINGSSDLYKQLGAALGFFIGYFIESRFIDFKESATVVHNVIKILLAATGALFVELILKAILPHGHFFSVIRYTIMLLWVTVGIPYLVDKFKLYKEEKYFNNYV
ncbi:phosphatase PAP2 family protein [Clostridium hydrogenum]|uniref:phosphatase PAP2 family protein n=1 Tax=Clostridium hydrogenum TaxID=2855764 RepID=UPI001F1CD570|nr:phosphatase PAP2 family protein [Clostridium hydrogenum]